MKENRPLVLAHQPIRFETAQSWNKGKGNLNHPGKGNGGINYPIQMIHILVHSMEMVVEKVKGKGNEIKK